MRRSGVWNGANKTLFRRMLPLGEAPDRFLVVTQTEFPGTVLIGEEITNCLGTFLLEPGPDPGSVTLRLRNCVILTHVRSKEPAGAAADWY